MRSTSGAAGARAAVAGGGAGARSGCDMHRFAATQHAMSCRHAQRTYPSHAWMGYYCCCCGGGALAAGPQAGEPAAVPAGQPSVGHAGQTSRGRGLAGAPPPPAREPLVSPPPPPPHLPIGSAATQQHSTAKPGGQLACVRAARGQPARRPGGSSSRCAASEYWRQPARTSARATRRMGAAHGLGRLRPRPHPSSSGSSITHGTAVRASAWQRTRAPAGCRLDAC